MNITASVFRIAIRLSDMTSSVGGLVLNFRATLKCWGYRTRTRRHLAVMDSHQLADIGLTAEDAKVESSRPFWEPVRPVQSGLSLRR